MPRKPGQPVAGRGGMSWKRKMMAGQTCAILGIPALMMLAGEGARNGHWWPAPVAIAALVTVTGAVLLTGAWRAR